MLKDMEYLGFTMCEASGQVVTFVFDAGEQGVTCRGPYTVSNLDDYTSKTDAAVIIINFKDGTMPISLEEFDDRLQNGESWKNGQYNIFTTAKPIGNVALVSKTTKKKVNLHEVRDEEGKEFYLTMLEQCTRRLKMLDRASMRLVKRAKKERRIFEKRLSTMQPFFSDENVYETYRDLIVSLLNEANNTADKSLVEFILQENARLEKQGVPVEKRATRIARATVSKYTRQFISDIDA